jgi:hypothetical protein
MNAGVRAFRRENGKTEDRITSRVAKTENGIVFR